MIFMMLSIVTFPSFAEKKAVILSISDVSANPGDTVFVSVKIENNSGFSNIAFNLNFDKTKLEYKKPLGGILPDFSTFDHSKNGRIAIAYTGDYVINENGSLVCFEFTVNKKAKLKKSSLSLSKTYISNTDCKTVKHTAKSGTLKLKKSCSGEHIYEGWEAPVIPTCTKDGIKVSYCTKCGHSNPEEFKATAHKLEDKFTIDITAKGEKHGMLSQHCTKCGAKTNIIVYTNEKPAALSINNLLDKFDETTISNLIYFLNGQVVFPEINYEVTDIEKFIADNTSSNGANSKSVINDDKTVNVDIAVDRVLRSLFGNGKQPGIVDKIKRAAISGEIPIGIIRTLVLMILV